MTLHEGSIIIDGEEIVLLGTAFKDIIFAMTNCDDEINIVKTHADASSIEVLGYDGDDSVVIGDGSLALDDVFGNLIIDGGGGYDSLMIRDQGSSMPKSIAVHPTMMAGIIGNENDTVFYFDIDSIDVSCGISNTNITVHDTPRDVPLNITTQDSNDNIIVEMAQGPLTIYSWGGVDNIWIAKKGQGNMLVDAGADDDHIFIDYLEGYGAVMGGTGEDVIRITKEGRGNLFVDAGPDDDYVFIDYLEGNGTVLGGSGDDLLVLDARGVSGNNTMDGSHLSWDGGGGNDTVDMYFISVGTTNLNIFGEGSEQVVAKCDDTCAILSQKTFVANIINSDQFSLERINLEHGASVSTTYLYLNDEKNSSKVTFDDTWSVTNVFGGAENDSFQIGQLHTVRRKI